MIAILANTRSMPLHLYDMQGYDPVQLSRYTDFVAALNGEPQDYHRANLRWAGVESPLLDILNVRYILVHGRIPPDREDVAALTAGRPLVFENENVRVYENLDVQPKAWIVHDVRTVPKAEATTLLQTDAIDPRRTALVEDGTPVTGQPPPGTTESVTVTRYEPEYLSFEVAATADGLLVVSEVYSAGWSAHVDGNPVEILPTDVALRGVPISAGFHTVEMRYRAPWFREGMLISLIAHLLLLASIGGWLGSRGRSQPAQDYATWPA